MKDVTIIQNYPLYIYGERDNNIVVKEKIERAFKDEYVKVIYSTGNIGYNKALKRVLENV